MARRARSGARRTARPARGRRRSAPSIVIIILIIVVGLYLADRAGWLPPELSEPIREIARELGLPGQEPRPQVGRVPTDVDWTGTAALLEGIRVEAERRPGYDREDWPHWLDEDGDCLHAREEVLVAESVEPARLSADGCSVVSGLWRDLYTGEDYRDPGDLDIDHLVALQEAHDSGGHGWDRERRAAYANDLEDPRTLIAVSASANRAKSAYGPEEWLPPDPNYSCRYVADWIAVKARWGLSMDESERVAVGNIVQGCR